MHVFETSNKNKYNFDDVTDSSEDLNSFTAPVLEEYFTLNQVKSVLPSLKIERTGALFIVWNWCFEGQGLIPLGIIERRS